TVQVLKVDTEAAGDDCCQRDLLQRACTLEHGGSHLPYVGPATQYIQFEIYRRLAVPDPDRRSRGDQLRAIRRPFMRASIRSQLPATIRSGEGVRPLLQGLVDSPQDPTDTRRTCPCIEGRLKDLSQPRPELSLLRHLVGGQHHPLGRDPSDGIHDQLVDVVAGPLMPSAGWWTGSRHLLPDDAKSIKDVLAMFGEAASGQ